jgi:muconolactone delta-isomerase
VATVSATTDVPDGMVAELRTALEARYDRRAGETQQAYLNRVWRLFLRAVLLERRTVSAQFAAAAQQQSQTDTDLPEA